MEDVDVYCVYRDAKTGKQEICILKSKAIEHLVGEGMSKEEAEEYYSFNIEGAMGKGQYSCVDDTLCVDTLAEMSAEDDVYDPAADDFEKVEDK